LKKEGACLKCIQFSLFYVINTGSTGPRARIRVTELGVTYLPFALSSDGVSLWFNRAPGPDQGDYGTRLADLKENWFLLFSNSTHTELYLSNQYRFKHCREGTDYFSTRQISGCTAMLLLAVSITISRKSHFFGGCFWGEGYASFDEFIFPPPHPSPR